MEVLQEESFPSMVWGCSRWPGTAMFTSLLVIDFLPIHWQSWVSLELLGKLEIKLLVTLINYLFFFPLRNQEATSQHSWVMHSSFSIYVTDLNVRATISTVQPRVMALGSGFSCSHSSFWSLMHKQSLSYTEPFCPHYDGIFHPMSIFTIKEERLV